MKKKRLMTGAVVATLCANAADWYVALGDTGGSTEYAGVDICMAGRETKQTSSATSAPSMPA